MEDKNTTKKIQAYFTEKDVEKRVNWAFMKMLQGLSRMLEAWGDMECKGGGCVLPEDALFHCKACTINGIKRHVDQAVTRWADKLK